MYVKLLGVLLLVSPSSETVNKPRENPDHVRLVSRPQVFCAAIFSRGCLAVFFRVTHDWLSERGRTYFVKYWSKWIVLHDITIGQVSPTESYHADSLLFPLWWTYFLISFQVLLWLFAISWIFFPQSTDGASKINMIKNIFLFQLRRWLAAGHGSIKPLANT